MKWFWFSHQLTVKSIIAGARLLSSGHKLPFHYTDAVEVCNSVSSFRKSQRPYYKTDGRAWRSLQDWSKYSKSEAVALTNMHTHTHIQKMWSQPISKNGLWLRSTVSISLVKSFVWSWNEIWKEAAQHEECINMWMYVCACKEDTRCMVYVQEDVDYYFIAEGQWPHQEVIIQF